MRSCITLTLLCGLACVATTNASPTIDDFSKLDLAPLKELWKNVNVSDVRQALQKDHPHSKLQTTEIAELYGYNAESHMIDSNGYLLTAHRITGNKTHPSPDGKPVVLLMHGLFCSSVDWVIAGPERGLAFLLADAGYDVWMGNSRGNMYSNTHKNPNITRKDYWAFSWHEMGVYDLPATVDYILKKTNSKNIFYVGHSQGATAFFVMASELPEYNDKITTMLALAPVTYSKNLVSPILRFLSKYAKTLKVLTDWLGIYDLPPSSEFLGDIASKVCSDEMIPPKLCMNVMFLFYGFNVDQFDMELLPAIISHVPAGSSAYQLYHFSQLIESGYFRQFDYGVIINFFKYLSFKPPVYKLEKVTVPVYIHYSNNDWLAHPTDVKTLNSNLPNVHNLSRVLDSKFNHIDFLYAKDVKTLLYDDILNILSKHQMS